MAIPQAQNLLSSEIHISIGSCDSANGMDNQSPHVAFDMSDDSAQLNTPLSYLLEHSNREEYLKTCVALYKYALKGDWEAAERILKNDPKLLRASISRGCETVLHVAAGARRIHFVEKLISMMDGQDLALQDGNGNTALCISAAAGSLDIVKILAEKNKSLLSIRGGRGMTPAYMAVLLGHKEIAWYLYKRYDESNTMLEETDRENLFFSCINNGLYDLALKLLNEDKTLATARTGSQNNKTALHILARRPSAFGDSPSPGVWTRLIKSCLMKFSCKSKLKRADEALLLVRTLWREILQNRHEEVMRLIKYPTNLLFEATELGNYEFLATLIRSYPELVWETDDRNRTIIHVAVLYRHASIFNLAHEIGSIKDVIVTYEDDEGNNIVHMAARLAPQNQLNLVSGVALQMHRELAWFKEVKRVVQPHYIEMENQQGDTPQKLFTNEHRPLMRQGELWMKDTATSCLLVATIIATVVFAAAFSIPGGIDDHTEKPNFIKTKMFLYFTIADAVALFSSSTAMLMFLFILTSRYAEKDFLNSLPMKLMVGLTSLFISIASMMMLSARPSICSVSMNQDGFQNSYSYSRLCRLLYSGICNSLSCATCPLRYFSQVCCFSPLDACSTRLNKVKENAT